MDEKDSPALPEPIRKHDGQPLFGSGQMREMYALGSASREVEIEVLRAALLRYHAVISANIAILDCDGAFEQAVAAIEKSGGAK